MAGKSSIKTLYRVTFVNQDKVYEVYARGVSQGAMFGFVEIEELVFGEKSAVVVDPGEEKLRSEFSGVKRTYIPLHAVLRIDEVAEKGEMHGKISAGAGKADNVTAFPVYTPGTRPGPGTGH